MIKKFLITITLLLSFIALNGQEQSGEFVGKVLLEDGSAVPGVTVKVKGTNLVGERMTVTDENGSYRLPSLPPGAYTITFTLEGFKQVVRKDIVLQVGKTLKIDGVMQAGAIQEEILVEGATPVVDVRKSAISTSMTKEVISKLPKGRNFTGVISTQAGVNYEDGETAGGYSFDGASASENTFFVDGMNTTTLESGVSGQRVDYDSVEEVQVKSSGYNAEYGGSMGGVVSVITKSGGNEFHGDLSLYYQTSKLSGNPRDILKLAPKENKDDPERAMYFSPRKDKLTSFEPGISLGGYIIKDRLWFFTSFIPQFEEIDRPGTFLESPEHNGEIFTRKNRRLKGSAKLTAAITNNLRVSFSGSLNHLKREGDVPRMDGDTSYDSTSTFANWGSTAPGVTLSGSLDYSVGNNMFINLSGGYYRTNEYDSGKPGTEVKRILFQNSNEHIEDIEHHGQFWSNISWAEINSNIRDISIRKSLKGDITYYLNAGGEHVFKAGVAYSNAKIDKLTSTNRDYWRFYWKDGEKYDTYDMSDGTQVDVDYGYVRSYIYDEDGALDTDRWALYLQDSWTIGNNLTINYGVRFEKEEMPAFSKDVPAAFKFGFFDKIAPRVGFAYDMNGDGTNKLFGSFGLYYDVMKLSMATGTFGGARYKVAYYNIVDPDWKKYLNESSVIWTDSDEAILGGELLELQNKREVPSLDNVQQDMKPYSKMEISLGYQRMLKDDLSLTVRFLHNRILNAIEDIGVDVGSSERWYIGNPGSDFINQKYAESAAEGHIPEGRTCPDPKREYYSLQFNFDKKFSNNWLGGMSLTLSRLWGNFSGLASTDESGRQDPNVARYFDSWFIHYDSKLDEATGLLPTDRPIQAKLYGAYTFDFGLTIGCQAFASSGTPVSRSIEINEKQGYYPDGRHSDGRTPFYWQVDLYAEYAIKLSDRMNLNVNVNITNLTDNKIARSRYNIMSEEKISVSNDELVQGFDVDTLLEEGNYARDPRFLMKNFFQPPIEVRFGAKLSF